MNLHDLTETELSDHLNAVLAEQERRAALATIPGQIASMSATFQAGGGDVDELRAAVG
ncbi:hypothetical protein [Arthrobacter alpinus]|uniref:hypothetical protein n=1 Tax=Arthrobacter alpinus TaxID=656366 RepID=UPI000A6D65D9|nr:hypothetical protein [Arthrobacter alpinus]